MTDDTPQPDVDVIVRTLAEKNRAQSLTRALDSIINQAGVNARPVVVVNGDRFDDDIVAALKQQPGVKYDAITEGSLVAARDRGLALVDAPVFMFLDDDDELLPGSLTASLAWLHAHPTDEVVITLTAMSSCGAAASTAGHGDLAIEPMRGLMGACWLHPGSGFFRNTQAMREIVNVSRSHMEWTTIAFQLLMRGTSIHFMDRTTVCYHDTAESLSKNKAHQEAELELMQEIAAAQTIAPEIRRRARAKYLNTLHRLAAAHQADGCRKAAWRLHLKSLCSEAFFKYVLYTRKLLRKA